jgi:chromosomal replication initiator protein
MKLISDKIADFFTLIQLFFIGLKELGIKKLIVLLSSAISKSQERNSLDELNRVAGYIGIPADMILEKNRKRDIVEARQVAMYLAKRNTRESLSAIGRHIGGKDHATVIHACKTVDNLLETNRDYRNKWLPLIISQ